VAEKELRGEPLTEEEYTTIRFYGGDLEHLLRASVTTPEGEPPGGAGFFTEEDLQAAVVADVATDPDPDSDGVPNPVVLEEAVGRIDEIHAVVPVVDDDGTVYLQVAKGGVFAYYEFTWPADDRLTDEVWRQMLDQEAVPSRPEWIASFFTPEGESSELTRAVFDFQKSLAEAVWFLESLYLRARGPAMDEIGAEIEALLTSKQYEGHQLLRSEFRSFDRQAADRAVVTVRETWQDSLYEFDEYPGGYPYTPDALLAERGPYNLDVTYTLERSEDRGWQVTHIVYANEPPEW
jgi:hypothetical protein